MGPHNIAALFIIIFLVSIVDRVHGFPCIPTSNNLTNPSVAKPSTDVQPQSQPGLTILNNTKCSSVNASNSEILLSPIGYHNLLKSATPIFTLLSLNSTKPPLSMEILRPNSTGNIKAMLFGFPNIHMMGNRTVKAWDVVMVCSFSGKGRDTFNVTELREADEAIERKCGSRREGSVRLGREGKGVYARKGGVGDALNLKFYKIFVVGWNSSDVWPAAVFGKLLQSLILAPNLTLAFLIAEPTPINNTPFQSANSTMNPSRTVHRLSIAPLQQSTHNSQDKLHPFHVPLHLPAHFGMHALQFVLLGISLVSTTVPCIALPPTPAPLPSSNTRDIRATQLKFNNTTVVCTAEQTRDPKFMLTPEGHHHLIASHRPDSIFHSFSNITYNSPAGVKRARSALNETRFAFLLGWPRRGSLANATEWDGAYICSKNGVKEVVEKQLVVADAAIEGECGSRQAGFKILGRDVFYGRVVISGNNPWEWVDRQVRDVTGGLCSGLFGGVEA
ncbi:hypothetical protein BJ508DRAFT_377385 [Ascobolus immersus RN42]|uniref:Ig-like domain-containing protein n=1 Tax=Ascobolus immersus RN42 TaxID=1160509 RepID=A0A3N4I560_ASCIM|nr:hypothetical protein BJ508DRAFT_377385 [Ascobolus immersus RN42]